VRTSLFPPSPDCPITPEGRRSTYARTLHRACVILGGVPGLAAHLGVAEADLVRWLQGPEEPPFEIFLAAVEMILLHLDAPGLPT
jgi:hypothetical protein